MPSIQVTGTYLELVGNKKGSVRTRTAPENPDQRVPPNGTWPTLPVRGAQPSTDLMDTRIFRPRLVVFSELGYLTHSRQSSCRWAFPGPNFLVSVSSEIAV